MEYLLEIGSSVQNTPGSLQK